MPLCSMKEMLGDARKRSYGVGYFNGINLEMIRAYVKAAEDTRSPIIIGTAEGLLEYSDYRWIAPVLLDAAKASNVPVAVHLDHSYSFDVIMRALRCGFGSVMYDGSDDSYETNVNTCGKIAEIAHSMGAGLEAELGKVGGFDEGEGIRGGNIYTDPEQAAEFVERTGADYLAVSIGTTHGQYTSKPKLDFDRLAEIRSAVDVPLVLHGGSGLTDDDFKNCVRHGISKINYYTDIINSAANAVRAQADVSPYADLCRFAEDAMYNKTVEALNVFGSAGRA